MSNFNVNTGMNTNDPYATNSYEPNYANPGATGGASSSGSGNAFGGGFFDDVKNTFNSGVRSLQGVGKDNMFNLENECSRAANTLQSFVVPPRLGDLGDVIPKDVLKHCRGIAVMNIVKAGFIWSGRIGSGVVVARLPDGSWSGPSAIGLAGAGIGGQIGAQLTNVVMILNTDEAVRSFYSTGSLTLGSNVSVAAGPLGRSGELSANVGSNAVAAVYSYSRSKGLFAGISIEGSGIMQRKDVNYEFYGQNAPAQAVLTGEIRPSDDIPAWNALQQVLIERCT
ncbi:hypothetical protein H4219_003492 [Mycoemilia scoparia]|uniref:Ysc84 actin-binding domain-containing protein n=1 Tax=Mycoemilia scoparia TaxID=417184 RepID=A0A9W8A0B3_9FUNG|nr:hypothetical protein H4219_003492 [Mycoemilia scoparia]